MEGVCFKSKVVPARVPLQVAGWEIQGQGAPACPGKLHLKLLSTAANRGKCDKPLGFSKTKCGPYTSSISIMWDLGRNADSQALPQIYQI